MAKVRILNNSGYSRLGISLAGHIVDARVNSYGAYGIKLSTLLDLGISTDAFSDTETIYFCSGSIEVLESD